MRVALLSDGQRIWIDNYKTLPESELPIVLRCAAVTSRGRPCLGDAWPTCLTSKVKSAAFAAHHIAGCTRQVDRPPSAPGDAGHADLVTLHDVIRITRRPRKGGSGGPQHVPDDSTPGESTRRSVPAGPGQRGHNVDASYGLVTMLGDLIVAGIPDAVVECPMTGQRHLAKEYILPLATARGATGWHLLYGEIYKSNIREESGSRRFEIRRGTRGTAHQALTPFVSQHMLDDVMGEIPPEKLVGRWIILLAFVKPGVTWCEPAEPIDIAIRLPPT